eukprot:9498195-Alexandrium_andersonii.AAC.1
MEELDGRGFGTCPPSRARAPCAPLPMSPEGLPNFVVPAPRMAGTLSRALRHLARPALGNY